VGQRTGTNAAGETGEQQNTCPHCGKRIRPSIRFCTRCGLELEADDRPEEPASAKEIWRVRATRILIGIIVAAGLAVGIIFVAHPFGHWNPTTAKSLTTPHDTPVASAANAPSGRSAAASPSTAAPSPSASSITERQAATSLVALLGQSGSERQAVSAAFNDADQCGSGLGQDAQTFQGAATAHHQLLNELAQLPGLAVLPSAMEQDLRAAWQASASADSDYAQWAQDQLADGCTASSQSDPGYRAANAPNQRATASKTAFVRQWNPLARAYGLPTYSQGNL
jgi:predicted nucleic acid-binding Zn ribbon protein